MKINEYILKQAEGLAEDILEGVRDLRTTKRLRTVDLEDLVQRLQPIRALIGLLARRERAESDEEKV